MYGGGGLKKWHILAVRVVGVGGAPDSDLADGDEA
jgi:hypothetical protein